MNNKGQAFSVFELLIAAIVAVAILFVLLPMITGGDKLGMEAKKSISNALEAAKTGGSQTSQNFWLDKDVSLTSKQFAPTDQHSIVFDVDKSVGEALIEAKIVGADWSYFKYLGVTEMEFKALVNCETTGASLKESLEVLGTATSVDPIELCTESEHQPCCLVMIKRA
ncbi:MAG: hypothetical protein NTZ73_01280 [Candidatus Diapherotrites archaeon]|nr:hypothetical protein [Candidatus Diapherotrites archaeon]